MFVILHALHALFDRDEIPGSGFALLQDDHKDPLARHNAVPSLTPDRTVGVAFLADLRELTQRRADAELRPNRELIQFDPLAEDVFRERAGEERDLDLLLQAVHALPAAQTDLPVPVPGVGIPVDPVLRAKMDNCDRVLLLPLFSLIQTALITADCVLISSAS